VIRTVPLHSFRRALSMLTLCVGLTPLGALAQPTPAPPTPVPLPAVSALHLTITAESVAGLPRRTVTVVEERGATAAYSGVDLGALLAKNGAPQGSALRGTAAAEYALVRASDGYRALFALGELDPALTNKIVLLADRRDGAPLDASIGPFRVIVPDEKHHVRWIRNVVSVDVGSAP